MSLCARLILKWRLMHCDNTMEKKMRNTEKKIACDFQTQRSLFSSTRCMSILYRNIDFQSRFDKGNPYFSV